MIQVGLDDLSKNSRKRYQVFKVSVLDDGINEWNTIHIHSRRRFSVIDQNNWRETQTNGGFATGICRAKKQQRPSPKKSGLVSVAQNRGRCITNFPNNPLYSPWNPSYKPATLLEIPQSGSHFMSALEKGSVTCWQMSRFSLGFPNPKNSNPQKGHTQLGCLTYLANG